MHKPNHMKQNAVLVTIEPGNGLYLQVMETAAHTGL